MRTPEYLGSFVPDPDLTARLTSESLENHARQADVGLAAASGGVAAGDQGDGAYGHWVPAGWSL